MSSSVAPLALSHALRRWIHNAPQDQQTLASAIETLRADEADDAVEVLHSALLHDPTLRWLSGIGSGQFKTQHDSMGFLPRIWRHDRIVRWVSTFLLHIASRVLVCHSADTGRVAGIACILQPSSSSSDEQTRLESVCSAVDGKIGPMMGKPATWQRAEWLWQKTASLRMASLPHKETIGLRASTTVSADTRQPAWHVLAMATRADLQGRGVGSLLLAEVAALGAVSQRAVVAQCSAGSHDIFTRRGYSVATRLRTNADDRTALSLSSAEVLGTLPSSRNSALRILYRPAMDRAGRNMRDTWRWNRDASITGRSKL